jgi:hypothetical protein
MRKGSLKSFGGDIAYACTSKSIAIANSLTQYADRDSAANVRDYIPTNALRRPKHLLDAARDCG